MSRTVEGKVFSRTRVPAVMSYPNRTSQVLRGKWALGNLLEMILGIVKSTPFLMRTSLPAPSVAVKESRH
jgi:hypothetical protein